jgi:hypothetical protein
MGAYELIISLDNSTLDRLMSTGLLRATVKRDIEVYEYYVNECKTVGKMQARTNTAEQFCTSEETISRIIQKMR